MRCFYTPLGGLPSPRPVFLVGSVAGSRPSRSRARETSLIRGTESLLRGHSQGVFLQLWGRKGAFSTQGGQPHQHCFRPCPQVPAPVPPGPPALSLGPPRSHLRWLRGWTASPCSGFGSSVLLPGWLSPPQAPPAAAGLSGDRNPCTLPKARVSHGAVSDGRLFLDLTFWTEGNTAVSAPSCAFKRCVLWQVLQIYFHTKAHA